MKAGKRVRGSKTGRPIMALLDLMGKRMVLRIMWELFRAQPMTFRDLQAAADTNPAVLNSRLKDLRAAELVEQTESGYSLTNSGRALISLLPPLHDWAEKWAAGKSRLSKPRPSAAPRPAHRLD
jgi:DNA-binding HxlR family transcriptional regulator